jgi:hypothetical protein
VRAFITGKTHPNRFKVRMYGGLLDVRKDGCAEWRIVEK